jgi:hypothetical protein
MRVRAAPGRSSEYCGDAPSASPSDLRDDLLEHLGASGCLALKHGRNQIEAYLLNSVSERHDREALAAAVGSWQEAHRQVRVDVVAR